LGSCANRDKFRPSRLLWPDAVADAPNPFDSWRKAAQVPTPQKVSARADKALYLRPGNHDRHSSLATESARSRGKARAIMLKKIGSLLFFLIVIVASIGLANFLSITFYEKPLLAVIKDLLFIFTRK
jgi:hypothetical protein